MKVMLSILGIVFLDTLRAQLNIEVIAQLDYEAVLNDVWGYVDEKGTEYALVGMTSGTSIVSLAEPSVPDELFFIEGAHSSWRDIKTWGDYAYVTADHGQQGLLIMDLSPLPLDTPVYHFWRPPIDSTPFFFDRAHNLWIDEFGRAFLAGTNLGVTIVVDVSTDPWNPSVLALMPHEYAHDIYVRNDIAYASEIYLGQIRAYDVSDLTKIALLGSATTPFTFTHNAWLSDNGKALFTTDEKANAFIASFDVSDHAEIRELDRFRPARTKGLGVIPHNVHVKDDYVIISYYTDGCIILDASRPDNLIEVGNYDTYSGLHGGINGAWGAYPFLPSGKVLVSDMQNGLFVLAPEYNRGCFLEGTIRNALTLNSVSQAKVEILLPSGDASEILLPEITDPNGEFKTGKAVPGVFGIRVSHPDYFTQEIEREFVSGEMVDLQLFLEPKPGVIVTGRVLSAGQKPVAFAEVILENPDRFYHTQADIEGNYVVPNVLHGTYRILATTWGEFQISELDVSGALVRDLILGNGYYDDFTIDHGWTITSEGHGSEWVRAEPVSQLLFGIFQCSPDGDLHDDFGKHAFVTGNTGENAEDDAVFGYTMLTSPMMDITGYDYPLLIYRPWLCQRYPEHSSFFVHMSNGIDTVILSRVRSDEIQGSWHLPVVTPLIDILPITNQMQFHFVVTNEVDPANVIKAGLDQFQVIDGMPNAVDDILPDGFTIYPNPSNGKFTIALDPTVLVEQIVVIDNYGRVVVRHEVEGNDLSFGCSIPGLYIVQLLTKGQLIGQEKVVVVEN